MSLTRKLQLSGSCALGRGGQHLEREPDRLSTGLWRRERAPGLVCSLVEPRAPRDFSRGPGLNCFPANIWWQGGGSVSNDIANLSSTAPQEPPEMNRAKGKCDQNTLHY